MKQNFAFHIFNRSKREKTKKKQEKFFIEIHAQRYQNTELKKRQKRKIQAKAATNIRSCREIDSFMFGFPMENAKAEP